MPKKTNLDENKKKEIENLIEELKDNATDITKAEIEELESLLDEVLKMERENPLSECLMFKYIIEKMK